MATRTIEIYDPQYTMVTRRYPPGEVGDSFSGQVSFSRVNPSEYKLTLTLYSKTALEQQSGLPDYTSYNFPYNGDIDYIILNDGSTSDSLHVYLGTYETIPLSEEWGINGSNWTVQCLNAQPVNPPVPGVDYIPYGINYNMYAMTPTNMGNFFNDIWAVDWQANGSVYNDLNSAIVSIMLYPFDLTSIDSSGLAADGLVQIGNRNLSTARGRKVSGSFDSVLTIGSITIPYYYNNYLDFAPYTTIQLWLPYAGFRSIDPALCMGRTLTVTYSVNLAAGDALAQISNGQQVIYTESIQLGIAIPITTNNAAQTQIANYLRDVNRSEIVYNAVMGGISGVGSLAAGAATGNAATAVGGVSGLAGTVANTIFSSQKNAVPPIATISSGGVNGGASNIYNIPNIYAIVRRPQRDRVQEHSTLYGWPCHESGVCGDFKGYSEFGVVHMANLPDCYLDEVNEIRQLLQSGVIMLG